MKITPDASLFQALSNNLPRVSRDAVNLTPGQARSAASAGTTGPANVSNPTDQAAPARDAARQEAIRRNLEAIRTAQRQFGQQTNTGSPGGAIQQPAAPFQSAAAQDLSQSSSSGPGLYAREAPGTQQAASQRPAFVRLGQILDISI